MTDLDRYPLWELLGPPSTFGRADRTAVRASGVRVLFADGRWRLCATSGLWNASLGYGNEYIAKAVHQALLDSSYLTLFRAGHTLAVNAAHALLDLCGPDHFGRVLFSTSGSAANDLVMKLSRQHWALRRQYQRRIVVGLRGSYHGLTYGSHALSGMALAQSYYSVDQRFVRHVDHDDPAVIAALMAEEGDRVAAVVIEPVLGTGAFPLSPRMLDTIQALREQYGFLLVADEVATGFARTGPMFASAAWRQRPDMLVASKAMTNGTCAVATVQVSHEICDAFDRADAVVTHAETQAGAPATCAAILATISEMERLSVLDLARDVAARLDGLLADLADHPLVAAIGGTGCFRAIRLGVDDEALDATAITTVVDEVRAAGALVQPGPGCIQLVPAFVYGADEMEELAILVRLGLDRAAETLAARRPSPPADHKRSLAPPLTKGALVKMTVQEEP